MGKDFLFSSCIQGQGLPKDSTAGAWCCRVKGVFFPPPLSHVSNLLSICLCYFSNFTYFTDNYVRSRNSCITNTDRIIDLLRNQFFLLLKKLALQKFFSVLKNSLYVRRKTQVYPLALLSPGSPLLTWELHKVVSSV